MTEIPERYLSAAQDHKTECLIEEMLSGDHAELLWTEIERMLKSKKAEDIDACSDMTLTDIITVIAEREAERKADAGDLDEMASEMMRESSEYRDR